MIFVTVGTHNQNFDRLIRAADELAARTDEKVLIQRGVSEYCPSHAEWFDWAAPREMEKWIESARCIVAQAGAGTIISVLKRGKPLVVIPRLRSFHEHHDDHQVELASALHAQKLAIMVIDVNSVSLQSAIDTFPSRPPNLSSRPGLVEALREKLHVWEERNAEDRGARR
jgi:UDP-N-acetylglucosamine transferase subunit ALG13